MARISTHVLDVAQGIPAEGIRIDLYFGQSQLCSTRTNADGRTDAPLAIADLIETGEYDLVFHAADYLTQPSFFGDITIRFRVTDPAANYHVPLLLAPYGYSTYRGS